MKKTLLIIIGVLAIAALCLLSGYNGLVRVNESVSSRWSQVENQLQRRNDLIPNLVSTVKGMAQQEKDVINSVTDARAKLAGAQNMSELSQADSELTGALSRLLVVVENYPTIKSDASFRQLSDELAGTENRIAVARKDYNEAVQSYNTVIKSFPTFLYATPLGFQAREYFKADEGAQSVPKVSF